MKFIFIITQDGRPSAVFAGRPSAEKWLARMSAKTGKSVPWAIEKFEIAPLSLDDETDEHLRAEAQRHMRHR